MRQRGNKAILITDAAQSSDDELKHRERRYIAMMAVRAGCVILATVLVMLRVPLLWLWVPLCALGMVLLPWLAVILANDRAPQDKHRLRRYRKHTAPGNALPSQSSGRTIDAEH